MFLLLTGTALALDSEHILSVGEEITPDFAGSWVRLFPDLDDPGAWHFLFGAGGDYNLLPMTADLYVHDANRVRLTGFNHLDDHSISKCPDGTYFHVGSGGVGQDNDSGYAWRYDADFSELASSTIEEAHPTLKFNDMAAVCSEHGTVAVFWDDGDFEAWFFTFDDDAAELDRFQRDGVPISTQGTTLLENPHDGQLLMVGMDKEQSSLMVTTLSWDLEVGETVYPWGIDDSPDSRIYWPQAAKAVGDRFLVAYMHQTWADGWKSDWGDLWLAIFDKDWNLLENNQITDDPVPDGSMRPGMQVEGDTLLLTYDRITGTPGYVEPRMRALTLDLGAFEDPEDTGTTGDTGTSDSGNPTDSGGTTDPMDSGDTHVTPPPPDPDDGCLGCASGGAPLAALIWLLPGLGLVRRRAATLDS